MLKKKSAATAPSITNFKRKKTDFIKKKQNLILESIRSTNEKLKSQNNVGFLLVNVNKLMSTLFEIYYIRWRNKLLFIEA